MSSDTELVRGAVVRMKLDPVVGSEQGGERPALILSPDPINNHSPIIVIAPLTTKKLDRVRPFETVIDPPDGGLPRRSKVLLLHISGLDKRRITGRYGIVSDETMIRVDEALKIATGLTRT